MVLSIVYLYDEDHCDKQLYVLYFTFILNLLSCFMFIAFIVFHANIMICQLQIVLLLCWYI